MRVHLKGAVHRTAWWMGAALLSAAFAGCAPTGSQTNSEALDKIGCQFESRKICEDVLAHPVNYASGITTSNQSYFQQNAPATVWEQVPIKAPGGSEVDVQCQIDTQNKAVIYAYATPSGTVSDSDRNWFKQTGRCRGDAATQAAPPVRAEE
jgi:hypothetical protein